MGHYDGSKMKMWDIARQYTLAIISSWGLRRFVPESHLADLRMRAGVSKRGSKPRETLDFGSRSRRRYFEDCAQFSALALDGLPKFVNDGNLTPDFHAVNTMQPPYQPSANKTGIRRRSALADPANPTTLPPQRQQTIGDLLSSQGVSWLVFRRLAGCALREECTARAEFPVPSPAV